MSEEEQGKMWTGSRGMTKTLRCKIGENAEECAERHRKAGWEVPSNVKLGEDEEGPVLVL
jgi:hypothetical protein